MGLSIFAHRILTRACSVLHAGPGHGMVKGRVVSPARPGGGGSLTSQAQNVPKKRFFPNCWDFCGGFAAPGQEGVSGAGGAR